MCTMIYNILRSNPKIITIIVIRIIIIIIISFITDCSIVILYQNVDSKLLNKSVFSFEKKKKN